MENLEKALIEIEEAQGGELTEDSAVPIQQKSVTDSFLGAASINSSVSSVTEIASKTMKAADAAQRCRKQFHVQFNPGELAFSGHGGGLYAKTDYSGGQGITFEPGSARITLDVKLIFDKTDSAKSGDDSVQTEVEGLIAALRSKHTRKITFCWGALSYTGIMNKVAAQYTMFNAGGQPIRAVVSLSMVCVGVKESAGKIV